MTIISFAYCSGRECDDLSLDSFTKQLFIHLFLDLYVHDFISLLINFRPTSSMQFIQAGLGEIGMHVLG